MNYKQILEHTARTLSEYIGLNYDHILKYSNQRIIDFPINWLEFSGLVDTIEQQFDIDTRTEWELHYIDAVKGKKEHMTIEDLAKDIQRIKTTRSENQL